MPDINIQIPISAYNDVRLTKLLHKTNAARRQQGLDPYPDYNTLAKQSLIDLLRDWVGQQDEVDMRVVRQAYLNANQAKKDAVHVALEINP